MYNINYEIQYKVSKIFCLLVEYLNFHLKVYANLYGILQNFAVLYSKTCAELCGIKDYWGVATWDGTWMRADLCEGQQRRNYEKWTAGLQKTYKEKKKFYVK